MKKYLLILITLIINSLFGQVSIPYYQNFQNYNFHLDENIYMDVASISYPNGPSYPPTLEEVIEDAFQYSWDLVNKDMALGRSLKLTVHKDDHPHHADHPNSRSEFSVRFEASNVVPEYYSWKFYIPNDSEYTENDNGWLMIGQFHDGIKKMISIQYVDDTSLNNNDKRRLYILVHDINENIHSRINLPNAIKKGQWHELIFKIKWSEFEKYESLTDYGYLSFWLDKKPAVILSTDNDNGIIGYNCTLSNNENDTANEFPFANLESGVSSKIHNLKFGHYRSYRYETNSMYFDDLRISNIFPNNLTRLKDEYCDITLPIEFKNTILEAYEISGATEYIAKFQYDGITKYVGLGTSPNINLGYSSMNFLAPGKTYDISIRAAGFENSDYGDVCSIYIPSRTKLKDEYCNITLPLDFENTILQAYEIIGATEYIAKFQYDGITKYVGLGTSPNINLGYSSMNFLTPGKTYDISIRAAGVENSDYGDICSIYIPSSLPPNNKDDDNINNLKSYNSDENETLLYPNPVSNILHIKSNSINSSVEVYYNGQKLIDKLFNNSTTIDFSSFQKGIYIIKINNTIGEIKTYKIVKY